MSDNPTPSANRLRFRAWHKKEKRWIRIKSVIVSKDGEVTAVTEARSLGDKVYWVSEHAVIVQSTGLHDKNGKEIFEGDVLLLPDERRDVVIPETGQGPMEEWNHLAPVVFQDGSFGCEVREACEYIGRGFYSFDRLRRDMGEMFIYEECETIGNIYENPELLHD